MHAKCIVKMCILFTYCIVTIEALQCIYIGGVEDGENSNFKFES